MATTRIRCATNYEVFHRISAVGDMLQTDTETGDAAVLGLGGEADFQIEDDETVAYVESDKQVASIAAIASNSYALQFLYIKHSGYQEVGLTNTTASILRIHPNGNDANCYFGLQPDEAIVLHDLGTDHDPLGEIFLSSSSGNIYAYIVSDAGST